MALSGSTRSQRAEAWVKVIPTATKLTSTDPAYARAARIQWGLKLTSPGSTCKVHLNKQSRIRGKELLENAAQAHGCANAATNMTTITFAIWCAKTAVKQAEKENINYYRSPHGKAPVHLVPLALDVYGRGRAEADKALTEAGRRRLAKKEALVATRNTRALGTL